MKTIRYVLLALVIATVVVSSFLLIRNRQEQQEVTDYQSCAAAGNPIRESYPAVCVTPDGTTYTQPVTDGGNGQ